jgi:D-alanine-D-alanine ligase
VKASPSPRTPGTQPVRTFGPVSDLERHLPSDWWRTLFNALYLKTDGDVVENAQNTARDIDFLLECIPLKPDAAILDLCCGQGRHCLELAKRGFTVLTGIDRSRYLIRLARKRATAAGVQVTFREGDARRFRFNEAALDCVMLMGNSFGYFERAEEDFQVLRRVLRILKPGGRVFLDIVDGEWMRTHFAARSWEWIDQNHFVCRERALAGDGRRLITREVITHAERGVIADQFYAERLYTRDEIADLLRSAGFTTVREHGISIPDSDRQQDLGMMAQRMILTAETPVAATGRIKRMSVFGNVTVLLGDPRKEDDVKRDGQFNPEDIETVKRMKTALGRLKGFEFRYFDNHDTMLADLAAEPPAFVFNLCDEGYGNDPFHELHVPAYLEMLNIPYSGGGPACLGMCYNKALVRALAQAIDVPVPLESYCSPDDSAATLPSTFPALLKPNFGDSSQGITRNAVVTSQDEFMGYWERLRNEFPGRSILVQEFLSGAEYSVGIIGNPGYEITALPVLEVDYSGLDPDLPHILGYESKWIPDSPWWNDIRYQEARLPEEQKRLLIDYSMILFERLECRDYARVDFRADRQGRIKLLEMNPNPGWCWDGKLNYMAGFAGMDYSELLGKILNAAQERYCAMAGKG